MTGTHYSAAQIWDMAEHIRRCQVCGDGGRDPQISAGLTESLPPEEMADFISSGHHPAWLALLSGNRDQKQN